MIIDLSNLKEIGSLKKIKKKVDLPDFEYRNQEISTPYLFELEISVYNTNDSYVLAGNLSGKIILICSRCLEKFEYEISIDLNEEILKNELDDTQVDLNDIFIENIILSLPMKHLCSEECKGLCTVCGQNLNKKECDCENDLVDPRLEKLKEFYKKDKDEE
ncbi:MAG: YceD family protein [Bacillota bacterium]